MLATHCTMGIFLGKYPFKILRLLSELEIETLFTLRSIPLKEFIVSEIIVSVYSKQYSI